MRIYLQTFVFPTSIASLRNAGLLLRGRRNGARVFDYDAGAGEQEGKWEAVVVSILSPKRGYPSRKLGYPSPKLRCPSLLIGYSFSDLGYAPPKLEYHEHVGNTHRNLDTSH